MNSEKRTAGDYEIIHALHIGDKEIVVGENTAAEEGQKYMCAFCQENAFFARYEHLMVSDDYPDIIAVFGQRVADQAEKTRIELNTPKIQGIKNTALTSKDCTLISPDDDLNNRIVIIKPDVLRREYRRATNQIKLCVGGFGASPHSRGSACYCVDLYTGKESRYERRDILGTLEAEQLPKWAKYGLEAYRQKQQKKDRAAPER